MYRIIWFWEFYKAQKLVRKCDWIFFKKYKNEWVSLDIFWRPISEYWVFKIFSSKKEAKQFIDTIKENYDYEEYFY